jgi:hypothetical protein
VICWIGWNFERSSSASNDRGYIFQWRRVMPSISTEDSIPCIQKLGTDQHKKLTTMVHMDAAMRERLHGTYLLVKNIWPIIYTTHIFYLWTNIKCMQVRHKIWRAIWLFKRKVVKVFANCTLIPYVQIVDKVV